MSRIPAPCDRCGKVPPTEQQLLAEYLAENPAADAAQRGRLRNLAEQNARLTVYRGHDLLCAHCLAGATAVDTETAQADDRAGRGPIWRRGPE